MFKIISGSSQKELARRLAQTLGADFIETSIKKFADEELYVQIPNLLYNDDVIIVQSTSKPANDHLMELLLLVDIAKKAGAKKITGLIPYFGYSRQDKRQKNGNSISAKLVATLIETAGVDHLITIDLHSSQTEGFFKISTQNINSLDIFSDIIKKRQNTIIISPDIGGLIRARQFSSFLGLEIAVINKSRKTHNTCEMDKVIGQVNGKHCIIIDDIIDTGHTICKAADILIRNKALSIEAFITHPVLSNNAVDLINQSKIKNVYTTNSIPKGDLSSKFKLIDLHPILIKVLNQILQN